MGGQRLPRKLPLQESGRARWQHHEGPRSTVPSRDKAQNLPNKVQAGAMMMKPEGLQVENRYRYVTALSVDLELRGDGSAASA